MVWLCFFLGGENVFCREAFKHIVLLAIVQSDQVQKKLYHLILLIAWSTKDKWEWTAEMHKETTLLWSLLMLTLERGKLKSLLQVLVRPLPVSLCILNKAAKVWKGERYLGNCWDPDGNPRGWHWTLQAAACMVFELDGNKQRTQKEVKYVLRFMGW